MERDRYFGISQRIARWKIDTPLENWLSYKADKSEFWKYVYVLYYKLFDAKYYRVGLGLIEAVINEHKIEWKGADKKWVGRDMIYCLHRYGISFQDFCIYDFINQNSRGRNLFVSDKLRYHYCDILNSPDILPLLTDKYACFLKYKEFFKREVLGCYSITDMSAFLRFADKHERFIYKPLNEHSGHGVRCVSVKDYSGGGILFEELIKMGPFIVEEIIVQGYELAMMHANSVNSLRVVTFVLKGAVHILGVTWRIGVGNEIVDNAGAGGIYASVDPVNGIVQTDAMNYRGEHYNIHPTSKVQIVGFKLPFWDDALSMIKAMATKINGTTLISWDIAYSNKGWLMVEANDNGDWSIIQSNKRQGMKEILYSYMDMYFE